MELGDEYQDMGNPGPIQNMPLGDHHQTESPMSQEDLSDPDLQDEESGEELLQQPLQGNAHPSTGNPQNESSAPTALSHLNSMLHASHPHLLSKYKMDPSEMDLLNNKSSLEALQAAMSSGGFNLPFSFPPPSAFLAPHHNNHQQISGGGVTSGGGGGGGNNSGGGTGSNNAIASSASSLSSESSQGSLRNVSEAREGTGQSQNSNSNNSQQQSTSWSFEEQFKQVRQLYEINDDPKRKEFLDDLFSFMQKRGTPINRLPIMAKSVLDLYELYNLVIARGGLVDVINKKLWQEIIKGLHLPSSITSAAFTLRTQYMKYLYPYECDRQQLSTQLELQAAIDGNRREGRRSSYGAYPGPVDFDSRMAEYVKLINKELRGTGGGSPPPSLPPPPPPPAPITNRQSGAVSPSETPPRDSALSALEFSRMTLWNMYNNNGMYPNIGHHTPISPHVSHSPHTRPSSPEQREALDLGLRSSPNSTSPNRHSPITGINLHHKREHDIDSCAPPPLKRSLFDDDVNNVNDKSVPTFAGTHIKISNRGDNKTGDNSLVVSMELNGVMYQGVLFAQADNKSRANATNNNTKSRSVLL